MENVHAHHLAVFLNARICSFGCFSSLIYAIVCICWLLWFSCYFIVVVSSWLLLLLRKPCGIHEFAPDSFAHIRAPTHTLIATHIYLSSTKYLWSLLHNSAPNPSTRSPPLAFSQHCLLCIVVVFVLTPGAYNSALMASVIVFCFSVNLCWHH